MSRQRDAISRLGPRYGSHTPIYYMHTPTFVRRTPPLAILQYKYLRTLRLLRHQPPTVVAVRITATGTYTYQSLYPSEKVKWNIQTEV